ncbi:16S rRNA (uracil(1498)-N(3))-methyltransferase [Kerstersia sp.]|uniref:16S rRNA (uracil(1498)-N(3))-methyltransferase n=1 Tax=Kerstersia sp. TaxID=1930783 RepID=UPI003F911990
MSAPRFFCPAEIPPHSRFLLPDAPAHHALRVLRLRQDSPIVLFDGLGGEYPATLDIDGKQAYALTGARLPREAELPGRIVLVQGLPSGDKMDWVIEKAVETGISAVLPVAAQRSVLQLDGERLEKRLGRWRGIVQSASEQCGRNRLLEVARPQSLAQTLASLPPGLTLFCHPDAAAPLLDCLRQAAPGPGAPLILMVGPEGGWSEAELTLARAHGAQPVSLGARVMRTETAGIVLASACSALLGWLD